MKADFTLSFFIVLYWIGILLASLGVLGLIVLVIRDWREQKLW